MTNSIKNRIETIRTVFQDARNFAGEHYDMDELIRYLENTNIEFRSVAFEGAAMSVAQKDFSEGYSIKQWNQLVNIAKNQSGHVHVGLGWAIAAESISKLSFINTIHPMMQFRVWDGCGYYNGIFKYRQSVTNQTRQHLVAEKDFQAFDQGLGRSLWYSCKGDVNVLAENIKKFSSIRQADLWRGIGIASVYVGGCDENIYKSLFSLAGKFRKQLGIGVALVAKSRILTNCFTNDTEIACNIWCNRSPQDVMELALKFEQTADSFESWLNDMEKEIDKTKKETLLFRN